MSGGLNVVDLFAAFGRIPGALSRYLADRKHRKWLRKAPSFLVSEMPENTFGKIVGHVRPFRERALEAPLSKRLCAYYDVSIDVMSDDSMLRTIASVQDGMPFLLKDNTGAAVIDPSHAFVSSGIDAVSRSIVREAAPVELALLERTQILGSKVGMSTSLRYREAIIEIDEMVAVYGGGVREPDPEGVAAMTYRDGVPTRLHLTGTAKFPLFVSDDPRAF